MAHYLYGVTVDFSSETTEVRSKWADISKMLKDNNCQPRILYPETMPFINEEK